MEALIAKPSDYNLSGSFTGSGFGHSQTETIARNIMLLMKHKKDQFRPFTWKQYKKFCSHKVTSTELEVIQAMAWFGWVRFGDGSRDYISGGYLDWDRDKETFSVSEFFLDQIDTIKKFLYH